MKGSRVRILVGLVTVGVVAAAIAVAASSGATKAKGQIILFGPASTDNYVAQLYRGAQKQAKSLGYTLKVIQNTSQSQEDTQVKQELASGKPAAYLWWPTNNKAGIASQRALAQSGVPTAMVNQLPIKGTDKYWAEYAGVNDVLNGQVSGKLLLQARKALVAKGAKLHSKGGNVIIVRFPAGYSAGDDRITGFQQATKGSGVKILGIQAAGFDPTTGFKIGSQLIAANKSKGIDFVYAENDALADGVIQALEQAGYKPGQNVMVIGGTCHGNLSNLISGKEFGTGLQAAFLEGVYDVNVIVKYLQTKKALPGQHFAPNDPSSIPPVDSVYRYNFIPNPPVTSGQVSTVRLWGYTMKQLCTY